VLDITERIDTKEKLRGSEERLKLGVEVSGFALCEINYATNTNHLSREAARLFGLGDDVVTTTRSAVHATFHPDDVSEIMRRMQQAMDPAGNGSLAMEHRIMLEDGEVRWLNVRKQIFFDQTQEPPRPTIGLLVAQDITERKHQEAKLNAAHDAFRHMVDNSPFGIYVVDADFRLVQVSDGAQKVFENVRPLLGRDFAEVLRIVWPEPFVSEAIAIFRHTLATGEPYHAPSTIEHREDIGEVESYDWKVERVALPDGRFGVVCHFYDLSERQRYEMQLRESETRFRATFEQAATGVAHVQLDGRWLRVNQRLCDILGYSHEEFLQSTVQNITHPADLEASLNLISRLIADDLPSYAMEKRYIHKDGRHVWCNLTVSLVRNKNAEPLYFIVVIEDITHRKAVEQALQTSEERFRIAENASHSFVYDYNIATGLEERSDGFTKILGYTNTELPYGGAMWETLIYPDDLAKVREATTSAGITEPPIVSIEYRLRHKNGSWIWVMDEFVVMYDAHGNTERIVGTIVDISIQKQQQQEIADLNTRLQRAIAETHHRVKNNLQTLSSLVGIQTDDNEDTVPVSALKRIQHHVHTLATLHDMLTKDAKKTVELGAISLPTVLEELTNMLQATAGNRTIRVRAEEVSMPLKQVSPFTLLVNEMVSNALKHGKGDIEVTLTSTPSSGTESLSDSQLARLEVCDDGPGFPADFDAKKAANTGLELIDSLGTWDLNGVISYENRPEGGARVVFTFPLS
jgi:PAS domain S-box-containing protein